MEKVRKWFLYLTTKQMPDGSPMNNPAGFIIEQIKEGQQITIDDQMLMMEEKRKEKKRTLAEIEEEEQEKKPELTQKGTKIVPVKKDSPKISAKKKFGELAGKAEKAQPEKLSESVKNALIPGKRNRLAEIRKLLSHIESTTLDAELIRMALSGEIHLYGHDDPTETTEEDRKASLTFKGEPKYIVYLA